MFVLIENRVEEGEPVNDCELIGSYPTFEQAHDEMVDAMNDLVKYSDPFDELETDDEDCNGYVFAGNGFCWCSWHIFEAKED